MIIDLWLIILLAVVQGLTEFLPVSSSGHLVLVESFFGARGMGGGILFEISVHVGTLAAVVMVYRRKIWELLSGAFRLFRTGFEEGRGETRYIGYMAAASLPAAAVGLLFRDSIEGLFDSPRVTALMLLVTAVVLTASRVRRKERELDLSTAFLIGIAQAIAIIPGCSRSGWTITAALLLGIGFGRAAEFSFLISIPAILGALVLEIWTNPMAASWNEVMPLVIGGLVAFLAGLFALRLLLRILRTGSMHRFSYYLAALGIAALIFFTLRG